MGAIRADESVQTQMIIWSSEPSRWLSSQINERRLYLKDSISRWLDRQQALSCRQCLVENKNSRAISGSIRSFHKRQQQHRRQIAVLDGER